MNNIILSVIGMAVGIAVGIAVGMAIAVGIFKSNRDISACAISYDSKERNRIIERVKGYKDTVQLCDENISKLEKKRNMSFEESRLLLNLRSMRNLSLLGFDIVELAHGKDAEIMKEIDNFRNTYKLKLSDGWKEYEIIRDSGRISLDNLDLNNGKIIK
jgi:hypothetical protein